MLSSPRPRNKLRKQPPSSFSVSFRSNLPRLRVNVATTSTLQGDSLSSPSSPASAVTVSVCSQAPLLDDNYSLRRTSTAPTRKLIKPRPQSYAPLHDLPSTQSLTSYSPPLPPKPNLVRRSSSFLSLGSWRGHQESHLDTLEAAGSASRTRSVSEGHADTRDDWSATGRERRIICHIDVPLPPEDARLAVANPFLSPESTLSPDSEVDITSVRQGLTRRDTASGSRRRWTLAMAMTDERITDEVLLHELERMRTHCVFTDGATHGNEWIGDMSDDHVYEEGSQDDCTSSHSIPFPPASTWQTTRRALLTCRELVRTERHYASALRLLLTADTSTSPPPLMLTYLSGLSAVSEVLLGRMEEDPSAWGVAAAFVTGEEDLESAYVGWCRVVGGFFAGKAEQARGGRWSGTLPRRTGNGIEGAWRKSIPSIAGLNAPPGVAPVFPEVRHRNGKARAKPNVRDLAILPTQRVTRYVLLYRDLLAHTPSTSPSRALVERAVDAAVRVAQKCDRAQGHANFLFER